MVNAVPDDQFVAPSNTLKRYVRTDPPATFQSRKKAIFRQPLENVSSITSNSPGVYRLSTLGVVKEGTTTPGLQLPSLTPITPILQETPRLSWVCPFCGREDCPFEASLCGLTVESNSEVEEWDLSEPKVPTAGTRAGNSLRMPLDKLKRCVTQILASKSFLASNKYVGNAAFDFKLRAWLKAKFGLLDSDVKHNWCVYRMAAKETMSYKRQQWEARIKSIFIRKDSILAVQHDPIHNSHMQIHACGRRWAEMELASKGNSGINRATFVRFATDSSGPDTDMLDADDDSVDARENYLCVREVGVDSPSTIRLLAWIVFNFVHLVADRAQDAWLAMLAQKQLSTWMTASDLAFTFLVLEHGINNWKRLARKQLVEGEAKNQPATELKGFKHQNGLAGKDAKYRYNGLLMYFHKNFFSLNKNGFAPTNMFLLQSGVNNLAEYRKQKVQEDRRSSGSEPGGWLTTKPRVYLPAFRVKGEVARNKSDKDMADEIAHNVAYRLVMYHTELHQVEDILKFGTPIMKQDGAGSTKPPPE